MGQLEVRNIGRVPAAGNRDNVVNARAQRMGILEPEIHLPAADRAVGLGGVYFFLRRFEGAAMGAVSIRPKLLGHDVPPAFEKWAARPEGTAGRMPLRPA